MAWSKAKTLRELKKREINNKYISTQMSSKEFREEIAKVEMNKKQRKAILKSQKEKAEIQIKIEKIIYPEDQNRDRVYEEEVCEIYNKYITTQMSIKEFREKLAKIEMNKKHRSGLLTKNGQKEMTEGLNKSQNFIHPEDQNRKEAEEKIAKYEEWTEQDYKEEIRYNEYRYLEMENRKQQSEERKWINNFHLQN